MTSGTKGDEMSKVAGGGMPRKVTQARTVVQRLDAIEEVLKRVESHLDWIANSAEITKRALFVEVDVQKRILCILEAVTNIHPVPAGTKAPQSGLIVPAGASGPVEVAREEKGE